MEDPELKYIVLLLNGPNHSKSDLVVKVNVISVAIIMENILKDDPGIVSMQLDGWIANHYGYDGLFINNFNPCWCVF